MSFSYYASQLSAERLQRCYEIAPPRVKQYLESELEFVLARLSAGSLILELGCGYGRILPAIGEKARCVVGIDTAVSSLHFGSATLKKRPNVALAAANAIHLPFPDKTFDMVVCIQNGISAFHLDKVSLVQESIRVVNTGGMVLFSSYAKKFWEHRLAWFRLQSLAGLLGEIDEEQTRDGSIVCTDGFTASTIDDLEFQMLTTGLCAATEIVEVDESSLFCVMKRSPNS